VATAYRTGKESDDLMAGAAASLPGRVIICARDKDLSAVVTDRVLQWWPIEKKLLGPKEVREKYGVDPGQIRDYLCLLGDDGDNIPGVPNIGPVTARRILNEYGSIANALKDKSVRKLLEPHKRTSGSESGSYIVYNTHVGMFLRISPFPFISHGAVGTISCPLPTLIPPHGLLS
jgi:5'-3' exonuclease